MERASTAAMLRGPKVSHSELEREARMLLELALQELSPTDAYVIRKRFGIGTGRETLEVVSNYLDVTRERVRQRQVRGERLIRKFLGTQRPWEREDDFEDISLEADRACV
jgi:DNA-directed RNA polymerase sigma subunit (sigma70/sigma32)